MASKPIEVKDRIIPINTRINLVEMFGSKVTEHGIGRNFKITALGCKRDFEGSRVPVTIQPCIDGMFFEVIQLPSDAPVPNVVLSGKIDCFKGILHTLASNVACDSMEISVDLDPRR